MCPLELRIMSTFPPSSGAIDAVQVLRGDECVMLRNHGTPTSPEVHPSACERLLPFNWNSEETTLSLLRLSATYQPLSLCNARFFQMSPGQDLQYIRLFMFT
jgi:hypothetical protein